jgi:hypothetical protein
MHAFLKELAKDEEDDGHDIIFNPESPMDIRQKHPIVEIHVRKKRVELPSSDEW